VTGEGGQDRQTASGRPSTSGGVVPRLLAILAMVATALVVVVTVVFLVHNATYVVLAVVGVAVAVAGGWWAVTERGSRRTIGIVALVIGAAAMVGAVVGIGGGPERDFLRLLVLLGLVVVAVVSARGALATELRATSPSPSAPRARPAHPVLLCNPWSGGGKVERFGLVERAESMGVETILLDRDHSLEALARDAVARGADCLGMAGGDGSQALVASIAVEHGLPFVCVSAGTRNHFALDLGLNRDDPRTSLDAFRDAVERRVDYATVNDRFFVNNVSLGVYATIVQQEAYREAKTETTKTLLPELLGRTDKPFDLQFTNPEGQDVDGAFLVMVSNNAYVLSVDADLSQRRRLDSGKLGVFAVSAETGTQAASVVMLAMAGKGGKSRRGFEFTTETLEVRSRSGTAFAGIDGEALELPTPLRFRIHPGGLRMLVPEGNLEAVIRRRARDVTLLDLVSIARGAPSTTLS
jgi:diacylglycerol kinase family enzyme